MFTSILFKGALVFVSRDFIHQQDHYPLFSGLDAAKYAEIYDSTLPTPELVDAIYKSATCKIYTSPQNPQSKRATTQHDITIRQQKSQCSDITLIDGHKKTIVRSNVSNKMGLYGWFNRDGKPIQPYTTIHSISYKDYSHGIRLVYKWAISNGTIVSVEQVLGS